MLIKIDHASAQPLHEQIAGRLRQAIAEGDPAAGERLPPARELAESLGVNVHTLLRAFQALRDEGLLEMRRGRGTTVTGTAPRLAAVGAAARRLVEDARRAGMADDDILQLVTVHL